MPHRSGKPNYRSTAAHPKPKSAKPDMKTKTSRFGEIGIPPMPKGKKDKKPRAS